MPIAHEDAYRAARFAACLAAIAWLLLLASPRAAAWQQPRQPDMGEMRDMPGMSMQGGSHSTEALTPAEQAKLASDRRTSEFNHHLAGVLVFLAGLFFLASAKLSGRWPAARYVWPACFLAAGIFLLVFSDLDIWPFAAQGFWHGIVHDAEIRQHKIFSAILLLIGGVELQRARGRLKAAWGAWVFPAAALAGAVLLLFHEHGTGMRGPDHMLVMEHIKHEHLGFAITGGAIAASKGLAETHSPWRHFYETFFPFLLMALGVLLFLYTE
ncbi:MAG: hypothetical protein ACRD52_18630 [Candidatus Acidiferrales bacterium]